jgi:heat-inducible transcriptional repressor
MVVMRPSIPDEIGVLRKVVDLYIETGQPVSSRMVKDFYNLDTSTANIRKVLHKLEEMGFLYKPHVSAGRMPSDLGYRLYVDGMRNVGPLSRRLADKIERKMGQDWNDVRDVISVTSHLLSEFTSYMGLTVGVLHERCVVERFDITGLEGEGAFVILRLVPGMVRKVYVEFSRRYSPRVAERAARMINERVAGHNLETASERLESFLRDSAGAEREIAEVISREAEYLFDWGYYFKYDLTKFDEYNDNQELANPVMLQRLVRLMGERSLMLSVLKTRMTEDVTVTIGSENKVEELEDFTLITRRFANPECNGILGILGPTRMAYGLVFSLLERMAEELRRVHVGEDSFDH